jgi:hypothetical protein
MGGQACVLYGAAEFSRDVDLAVLADPANLERLRAALVELDAESIYVPPLSEDVLRRGHACHFRARSAGVEGFRIDVMSVLHGCDSFDRLWRRRNVVQTPGIGRIDVLSLADLVQAKKTQRDKDWPMIRRLVEADYYRRAGRISPQRVRFWLREARTAPLLVELCHRYQISARKLVIKRPLLKYAIEGNVELLESELKHEEDLRRAADRAYWEPLRAELTAWRHQKRHE